jgi:hypothetical protein
MKNALWAAALTGLPIAAVAACTGEPQDEVRAFKDKVQATSSYDDLSYMNHLSRAAFSKIQEDRRKADFKTEMPAEPKDGGMAWSPALSMAQRKDFAVTMFKHTVGMYPLDKARQSERTANKVVFKFAWSESKVEKFTTFTQTSTMTNDATVTLVCEDEAWRLDKESWNQDNSVVRQPLSGKAEAPQVTKMRAKFP